ncbi:unnamed protein product [marine sediment metagenome]|uniref:MalT-like TPR region domain-containing protein n=1 Tax=marine sediment metagenome TaxID=412755 RepID=X1T4Z8_9ZZZZ
MKKNYLKYFGESWRKKLGGDKWVGTAVDLVNTSKFQEAVEMVKPHTTDFWDDHKAASYSIMGIAAHVQNQLDNALSNYNTSLKITKDTIRIHDMIPDLLLSIALIFIEQKMFRETEEILISAGVRESDNPWFLKAVNLYEDLSGKSGDEILNEVKKQFEENVKQKQEWIDWIKETLSTVFNLADKILKNK